ncbi:hypothetical protein DRN43_04585 [Thermococci archaeon]|nr:MAG: hypothetical protein DRN43_04585 [Thermococci archaeon]
MELFSLIKALKKPEPLKPSTRAREFQLTLQKHHLGDEIEVEGFLLLRQPAYAPKDAVYYMLSPLSPSDIRIKDGFTSFAVLKITDKSRLNPALSFKGGEYVRVRGTIEAYPCGTLRTINVKEMEAGRYENYWLDYKEYALSRHEMERLFLETFYTDNYQLEIALLYSLFASPSIVGAPLGEGSIFSTLKDNEKVIKSLWSAMRYLLNLFPRELRLMSPRTSKKAFSYVDEDLDLDFKLFTPQGASIKYYSPENRRLLGEEIPASKWARPVLNERRAIFLAPKRYSNLKPNDPLAYLSETPFIPGKPIGYERNREFEQLIPNLIVTIHLAREQFKTFSPDDAVLRYFRRRFNDWLRKNRREYGEKFDALRLNGRVFETNMRFLLSMHLLGEMSRFEGRVSKSIVNNVLTINQDLVDTWINELSERELIKSIASYEKFVDTDKRGQIALSIFMDLEATSVDKIVDKQEFYEELVKYGFNSRDAGELIEKLIREGYLFEVSIGKLKLVVR